MWFLVLLVILASAAVLWKFRVPLLARVLGQPEARVARQLRKKQQ